MPIPGRPFPRAWHSDVAQVRNKNLTNGLYYVIVSLQPLQKIMKPIPDWMQYPPRTLIGKAALLRRKRALLTSPGPKGRFLRSLLRDLRTQYDQAVLSARDINPLAFFRPSYEQALILNAWMYGITFTCIYAANRIGKTTVNWIDKLLWIIPNDPRWLIFQPYQDHLNRTVQVFPRPSIHSLKRIKKLILKLPQDIPRPNPDLPTTDPQNQNVLQRLQKNHPDLYAPAYPLPPWDIPAGTIWFGGPDQDHHEQILFPLLKQYTPSSMRKRYVPSAREMTIEVPVSVPAHSVNSPSGHASTSTQPHTNTWTVIGKSYESKDTKWSSGAVDMIMLTEGITPEILKEIKPRFKDPGIGGHDFTPYLASNAASASALARRIASGKEEMPLTLHAFTAFSARTAPNHIIPKDKLDDMIRTWSGDPQGAARLEGKFWSSSGLVLEHLSRHIHLLPFTKDELFALYPNARLYRGLDPGLDHPTACAWGALLPTNQWVIYRIFSKPRLSIAERCAKIIQLSNNTQRIIRWGKRPTDFYLKECHTTPSSEIIITTPTDYHVFKEDEVTGRPYSLNYILQGLQISESTHLSPEQRAQSLDTDLAPSNYLPSLITHRPPGPRVLFLKDEPGVLEAFLKWEEFYWERKKSGPSRGDPSDKVPDHGDDELDAVCYLTCSPFVWTSASPRAIIEGEVEIDASLETMLDPGTNSPSEHARPQPPPNVLQPLQKSSSSLQPLQKPREIVYFGDPES